MPVEKTTVRLSSTKVRTIYGRAEPRLCIFISDLPHPGFIDFINELARDIQPQPGDLIRYPFLKDIAEMQL
jgi:hypothetical protein